MRTSLIAAALLLTACYSTSPAAVAVNSAGVQKQQSDKRVPPASPARLAVVRDSNPRAIRIHDSDGQLVRRIELGEYVTDLETAGDRLIVYTYPDANRNGVFRTLAADGTELAKWTVSPPVDDSSIIETDDGPAILSETDDGFVLHALDGREVRRFSLKIGEGYAAARGVRLAGDRWALVATGSGYLPQSTITVFEGDRLVYSEVVDGRANAVTKTGEDAFVVGIDGAAWKYSLPGAQRVP